MKTTDVTFDTFHSISVDAAYTPLCEALLPDTKSCGITWLGKLCGILMLHNLLDVTVDELRT